MCASVQYCQPGIYEFIYSGSKDYNDKKDIMAQKEETELYS